MGDRERGNRSSISELQRQIPGVRDTETYRDDNRDGDRNLGSGQRSRNGKTETVWANRLRGGQRPPGSTSGNL